LCLTKLYYVLNKTKYINTLQAVARSGVAKRLKENEKEQDKKKITPPSRICSNGGGSRVVMSIFCSLLFVSPSLCALLFVICTSVTRYKQWLVGGLVVL
jgi:hypothetical protein